MRSRDLLNHTLTPIPSLVSSASDLGLLHLITTTFTMALREDLINNAVAFLVDPEIADKPLAKKVEFLESKELSAEEIEEALSRANKHSGASSSSSPAVGAGSSSGGSGASYVAYQRPPPPLPRRDWRDYFVMATVAGGVAYGLYEVTRRYVVPLIVPPTPSALETDKQALENEFARQEALLEQLQRDTEEIKQAEVQRSEQYETLFIEAKTVIDQLKAQAKEREHEVNTIKNQVESIRDALPKSLERQRGLHDKALTDLQSELKSLKQLLNIKFKSSSSSLPTIPPASAVPGHQARSSSPAASTTPTSAESSMELPDPAADISPSTSSLNVSASEKPKSSIPAWQLAAASKAG